jgi:hypothetical protein
MVSGTPGTRGTFLHWSREASHMKHKKPLEPEDFPVQTENTKITKSDGETIADAKNDKMAEEICDRLNTDHAREEEDRWA